MRDLATAYTWTGAGIGKGQLMLNRWSLEAGGHCRPGLADNIRWDETGKLFDYKTRTLMSFRLPA